MTESLQKKHARLVLLLSTQGLNAVSKDDEKEHKEEKHMPSVETKPDQVKEIEIEPLRIIDNVNDNVYVMPDRIAARTDHNRIINASTKNKPSNPTYNGSSSVSQQRSVCRQNIQQPAVIKKPKRMPVYSKIVQKEKVPAKKINNRKVSPSTKHRPMKCISNEDREQIVAKYESGWKLKTISDILNIPKQTVENVVYKYKRTGNAAASSRDKESPFPVDVLLSIRLWMYDDCNVSLTQLVEKVWSTYQIRVSNDSIMRTLIGFNYFFNRVQTIPKHKNVNSTQEQMKEYATSFTTVRQNVSKLGIIFLDYVALNATFKVDTKLRIQHKTFFVLCAMNESGMLHYLTQNTHVNMDTVTEFVYEMKNKLRELNVEESVVVIGSTANQRYAKLQDAIGYYKCNATFLPSNAAYLNPVEYLSKNLKRITGRANPRTIEEVMKAVESIPSLLKKNDYKNWFELMRSYVARYMEGEIIDSFDVQD
ncbi:uncharacterized protein LOC128715358 [Anopheles marshallii]|uniref:uncharacterized protein LOC128715358 n=1 Tax=Anopheles marshallii TaxID=1521116 RepID=UPI00237A6CB3|nr:uncharacterized protein LOC128715358 [Anopheles marshallii]